MITQTFEPNKLLALGEKLRENPDTILLSLPVLAWAIVWYGWTGNKPAQAGGFGHLGLAFKLYYKHHWQNQILLKIAYWLLTQALLCGDRDGQPTVKMVMGSISLDLGDKNQAKSDYEQAVNMAKNIGDQNQMAFVLGHLGRIKTQLGDFVGAKKDLDLGLKILTRALKKDSAPRLHIWISNVELAMSEWYLAAGDKKRAKLWVQKVATRAEKYDLKTRKLDAKNLLSKIANPLVIITLLVRNTLAWIKS